MGVMDTLKSIFGGGLTDDDIADGDKVVLDKDQNGLDDSVDKEMAINAVNADIEASKEGATDQLLHPGMEEGLR
jgi:hypothetical protein